LARNHCPHRSVLGILKRDGTMAEYLTLPVRNLHVVPDDMPDEVAVFAEPVAAACRIVEQHLISYDTGTTDAPQQQQQHRVDKVAILGDGKLGLMIAEVLGREHVRQLGAKAGQIFDAPVLFGKHPDKLQLVAGWVVGKLVSECCSSSFGPPTTTTPPDDTSGSSSFLNAVVSPEYAGAFDVVVDATGSPSGLLLAAALCRPMGTVVLKSTCSAGEKFNAAPFVIDELKVIGSRCGPLDQALELMKNNNSRPTAGNTGHFVVPPLHVTKYITKTFPLVQADEAMRCAAEKSTMKVQIICSDVV
jgi:threonine dehydrogenase-like Zn-dependent dehydrogenase